MVQGGGSRGGNNGGKRNNGGKVNRSNNDNQFSSLDQSDHHSTDDTSSPFYLSNGDHPGFNLVFNHLLGTNYNSCNRAMTMALIAKNKTCFVNGSISRPKVDDHLYSFWSQCNNMVMSWILHVVSKNIAGSIMYVDNACDMWNDLHDRFNQSNGPRIFELKQ
ncbi:hypothetical protein UlMin_038831 [Ulmus minor]